MNAQGKAPLTSRGPFYEKDNFKSKSNVNFGMAATSAIGVITQMNSARHQNLGTSNLMNKATISTVDQQFN